MDSILVLPKQDEFIQQQKIIFNNKRSFIRMFWVTSVDCHIEIIQKKNK
jgi:hypothetical protein